MGGHKSSLEAFLGYCRKTEEGGGIFPVARKEKAEVRCRGWESIPGPLEKNQTRGGGSGVKLERAQSAMRATIHFRKKTKTLPRPRILAPRGKNRGRRGGEEGRFSPQHI